MKKYSLYRTGRISIYDKLRLQQGLEIQNISNLSMNCMNCKCCYEDNCLYPFKSVKLDYCCIKNPNNCDNCTMYIQPI